MKRMLCLMLALMLLCGCGGPATPSQTAPTNPPAVSTAPTESLPPPTVSQAVLSLRENFPTIDGSTSLIPLEAGIRAAIFDISLEEATSQVIHSTTWESFYNMVDGKADLVLTCPPSQDQYEIAASSNVELEQVPVAMEGFVFVVNAKNPVSTLTQQQLKDIYSGKITNWKEVGGRNEEIIPYQRNYDSGSQNFMIEFMGDTPLMDAPIEHRPASMEGLMDVVAINDNASGAIGYSVYAYAADMYGNGNEIKFIKVDGVAPSKKTFADKSYPLLGKNYAIFHADQPEDSPVRALVDWMTSYEGQLAIARAGYVTADDIGFDYEEMALARYSGTGAGPKVQPASPYFNTLTQVCQYEWGESYSEFLPVEVAGGVSYVKGLANASLEAQINDFIQAQMEWVAPEHEKLSKWVAQQLQGEEYGLYSMDLPWFFSEYIPGTLDHACIITAKNGYLSVAVTVCGSNNRGEADAIYARTETATWDLLTGKRLQPEELFFQGVDIDEVLNDYVRRYSQSPADYWMIYPELKQEFVALPKTGWHLTHDAIYFDMDNPYFLTGCRIPLSELPDDVLVTQTAREFEDTWDGDDALYSRLFVSNDRDIYYAYNSDELVSCGFLKEEIHPNAAVINRQIMDVLNTNFTKKAILDWYAQYGVREEQLELWMLDWSLYNFGGKYLAFQGTLPYHYVEGGEEADRIVYPFETFFLYDLESGKQISWENLLKPGWKEHAQFQCLGEPIPFPEDVALAPNRINQQNTGDLDIGFQSGTIWYNATIPWEYVNHN